MKVHRQIVFLVFLITMSWLLSAALGFATTCDDDKDIEDWNMKYTNAPNSQAPHYQETYFADWEMPVPGTRHQFTANLEKDADPPIENAQIQVDRKTDTFTFEMSYANPETGRIVHCSGRGHVFGESCDVTEGKLMCEGVTYFLQGVME